MPTAIKFVKKYWNSWFVMRNFFFRDKSFAEVMVLITVDDVADFDELPRPGKTQGKVSGCSEKV